MASFEVRGMDDLMAQLDRLGKFDEIAPKMMDAGMEILQKEVVAEASKHKDTGEMVASIKPTGLEAGFGGGYYMCTRPTGYASEKGKWKNARKGKGEGKGRRKIETLYDVGLSYIRLGQPSTTLSGGEAQRIKLAAELSKRSTGKTIYILDEPTTGLHFADVHKLVEILKRLSEGGNTVVVIEHNLDVIKTADYIIDIGPEGGDRGGTVVAFGTPEQVAANPSSYTGQYVAKYLR